MNTVLVIPAWVQQAKKMPIYFSQVREDAFIDLQVGRLIGKDLKVMMVASGGCTAAALAGSGFVSVLHMVDISPSQLALTKLKLKLLSQYSTKERLSYLGYKKESTCDFSIAAVLDDIGLKRELFGHPQTIDSLGLDFCGRYEQVFAQLQKELSPHRQELAKLLAMKNPLKQIII